MKIFNEGFTFMKFKLAIVGFFIIVIIVVSCLPTTQWELNSPDDQLKLIVKKDDGEKIEYRILYKDVIVLDWSQLSMGLEDRIIGNELSIQETKLLDIEDDYKLVHGKKKSVQSKANELVLYMQDYQKHQYNITFKIFNDAVAFRYNFWGNGEKLILDRDSTNFCVNQNSVGFLQPYQKPDDKKPCYEDIFHQIHDLSTSSPSEVGWAFPALYSIEKDKVWMLVTEAGIDENQCAFHFKTGKKPGEYTFAFPEPEERNHFGKSHPDCELPWHSPWRAFIIGDSLRDIVESSTVTHVNPSPPAEDYSWVLPGRVSWSWWSTRPNDVNYDSYKSFIDLAAKMGWEYSLIDADWPELGRNKVIELVAYAKSKSVDIILWYNSGGPECGSDHTPIDRIWEKDVRQKEMAWLNKIGVKGVKIDFFGSDKNVMMKKYIDILKDAAEYKLMVNFHGSTLPRGWSRTYPQLMSMEAVNGAERYLFNEAYKDIAPTQNTILPFTRNVVGPMDFTPVTFSAQSRITTEAHELALSVIFQSGWQHFPDKAEEYSKSKWKEFLKEVPVDWDDIHFINGYPGDFVCLARRYKNDWYIAAINNGEAKTIKIPLDFVKSDNYKTKLYHDKSDHSKEMVVSSKNINNANSTEIRIGENGGIVFVLKNSFRG